MKKPGLERGQEKLVGRYCAVRALSDCAERLRAAGFPTVADDLHRRARALMTDSRVVHSSYDSVKAGDVLAFVKEHEDAEKRRRILDRRRSS